MQIRILKEPLGYVYPLIVRLFLFVLQIDPNLCIKAHEPQRLFNQLRSNPEVLRRLRQSEPQLVDAVEQNDMSMIRFL
jgi:hypothetical protein